MRITQTVLIGLLCVAAVTQAHAAEAVAQDRWIPLKGDSVIVNTETNWGYLLHEDNSYYMPFKVATGKRSIVRYIGLTYNATTPEDTWIVKSIDIKRDRITFGSTGTFMRLYKKGVDTTLYGIHSVSNIDTLLEEEDSKRFKSMGCILVSDSILKMLQEVYTLNNNSLTVTTSKSSQKLENALEFRENWQQIKEQKRLW